MAWIREIEEADADADLQSVYRAVQGSRGKLSNILKVHSLNPKAMQSHMDLYMAIMFDSSGIKRADRELIAVVVSAVNNCAYCIRHHAEALMFYWKDRTKVDQAARDFRALDLPEKTRAMLEYAETLSRSPDNVQEAAIEKLRTFGFNDEQILSVALITAYFNFVNRIALGLGVESSVEETQGYSY